MVSSGPLRKAVDSVSELGRERARQHPLIARLAITTSKTEGFGVILRANSCNPDVDKENNGKVTWVLPTFRGP